MTSPLIQIEEVLSGIDASDLTKAEKKILDIISRYRRAVSDGTIADSAGLLIESPLAGKKPVVRLSGTDGNVLSIIAHCKDAMKKAGWSAKKIDAVVSEMFAGDYNNVLKVARTHLRVE